MQIALSTILAALSVLAMASFPGYAAPNRDDPLATYRGKARVLVVLASDPADPRVLRQRKLYDEMKQGADERDLALVEAIGSTPEAKSLRRILDLDEAFHAVLVGKDGGSKFAATVPLGADKLFPLIDSMPMRQDEMKRQ